MFRVQKLFFACFMLCATIASSAAAAFAAQTPEEVVKEMLGKIKSASNASPIVEYVDWDEAYAKASDEQKKVMNVAGPKEMKAFYLDVLKNPSAIMKKQFAERIESVPAEQRPMMEASMKKMEEVMAAKEKEMKDRIANTQYEVGKAEIEGDNATVKLKQTYGGETKEDEVKLVKRGSNWMLPTVSVLAPEGKAPPAAPPATN